MLFYVILKHEYMYFVVYSYGQPRPAAIIEILTMNTAEKLASLVSFSPRVIIGMEFSEL